MKILFTGYVNSSQYSDPENWLERIEGYKEILEVLSRYHEVHSIEQINYTGRLHRNGVHYHFLNFKKNDLLFPFQLHSYIKKLEPDIAFVHGLIFPLQVIQLKWSLGKSIRIIVQNHAEKPFAGWKRYLQKYADKFVDSYLFTSFEMSDVWFRQRIISDRSKIVEVMEASSFFRKEEKNEALITSIKANPVFLWVGRLDLNKDPVTVLKAFIRFLNHAPSSKLYMIYQTEDLIKEVKFLIDSDKKARENIVLLGKIPHLQLQTWYNSVDFIISGSHYEGSGVAVCEAMACGCIPIVTNIASFRKMTGYGCCGLLYEPGNSDQLLSALLKTKTMDIDSEKRKVIYQFEKELSFEAIATKINEVIGKRKKECETQTRVSEKNKSVIL